MVCKNRDTYGFLGTSWVLITMDSRKLQYDEPDLPSSSSAHSSSCCPRRCSRRPLPVLSVEPFKLHHAAPPPPSRIRKNLPAHQAHWYVLSTPPSTTRDFLDKTIKQTPSHVVDREITTSSLQSHRFRSVCPLLIGRFCRKLEIHPRGRYLLLLRSNSVLVLYIYGLSLIHI